MQKTVFFLVQFVLITLGVVFFPWGAICWLAAFVVAKIYMRNVRKK
ncbi:hypothetical protein ISS37_10460 [candidate division KSB1 bacterium]|nr:hypothetical protein [candidate division KSB1 bacterium]